MHAMTQWSRGTYRIPSRTYKAAIPFGAPYLWPTMVSRSIPWTCTSMATLPNDYGVMWCDVWCVVWCDLMLCDVMRGVMWCCVLWWNVMRCDVMRWNVMWWNVMRCDVMKCDVMWWHVMCCEEWLIVYNKKIIKSTRERLDRRQWKK